MARRKLSSDINVVPYIDVMLVLLIIFMITAPLLVQGIEIDLPEVDAQSLGEPDQEVILSVNARGQMFLNVQGPTDAPLSDDDVRDRVGAVLRNKPDKMILVEGDGRAAYQHVARAMALLQESGAHKLGFLTQPTESKPEKAPAKK